MARCSTEWVEVWTCKEGTEPKKAGYTHIEVCEYGVGSTVLDGKWLSPMLQYGGVKNQYVEAVQIADRLVIVQRKDLTCPRVTVSETELGTMLLVDHIARKHQEAIERVRRAQKTLENEMLGFRKHYGKI